jgi:ATP-dependent DNA helicase RecG
MRRLDELLELNVSVRTQVTGASREMRRPDYPVDALRQLAHNAVMHRSYEGTNTPVRVHWFADRVEITSPGSLYGRITPENLGTGGQQHT